MKASYDSAYGIIRAESTFSAVGWSYICTLPANTTAELRIPASSSDTVSVNGKVPSDLSLENDSIVYVGMNCGNAVFEAISGVYEFVVLTENA